MRSQSFFVLSIFYFFLRSLFMRDFICVVGEGGYICVGVVFV